MEENNSKYSHILPLDSNKSNSSEIDKLSYDDVEYFTAFYFEMSKAERGITNGRRNNKC